MSDGGKWWIGNDDQDPLLSAEIDAPRSTFRRVCFNWTAPAIWPHALPDITRAQTTEDTAEVNCPSCQWALGSQKHEPPPTRVIPPEVGR